MKYSVIIPVVNRSLASQLLASIATNTIIPDDILIVDNSMSKTAFPHDFDLPLRVIDTKECLGVNASWNLGIRAIGDCDYVAILNDDVVLGKSFFERNIHVFKTNTDCGAACPGTVFNLSELEEKLSKIILMKKREGWAMSFRWDILKAIPPIPDDLKTFCGDDWFWLQTGLMGYYWYKDTGNIVYHKVGEAVRALGVRKHLRQDKAAFNRRPIL